MSQFTLYQLEQYLSKDAWILKGPIGASDFKAYIFPMLFFKRISDVYDEQYQAALTEHFLSLKTDKTPAVDERIVNDIDEIVKAVRFDGWQDFSAGQREVNKALRQLRRKYKLDKDDDLFDRAYIREYY